MPNRSPVSRTRRAPIVESEPLRLQKVLSQAGLGSRRDMEELIRNGRVMVNDQVAELGMRVSEADRIRVNGRPFKMRPPHRLPRIIIFHKPEGEIVSRSDPQGRPSVFDRISVLDSSRWVAVGRLDFNTSGLLIFTTSGELANRLTHPSFEVEREYAVRLLGELTPEQITQLKTGIPLDDGEARFDELIDNGGEGINHWYRVIIKEGRNREVRRMFESLGLTVSRLMRVRFGSFSLPPRLKRGQWVELEPTEVEQALRWVGMKIAPREPGERVKAAEKRPRVRSTIPR